MSLINLMFFGSGHTSPGFIYGNLVQLYPSYTSEQITELREYNFSIFQTLISEALISGETIYIHSGRIEVHYGTGTQINIPANSKVTIRNYSDIFIYPFIRTANSILFYFYAGVEFNLLGSGSIQHYVYPNKVEAYNSILAYGGNKSVVKLTTTPRAGFLDSIVGQTIYVSPGMEIAHVARTVVSYNGDEITLNSPLSVADNENNYFTNISYKFPEDISEEDYLEYGGFWWGGYAYEDQFIFSIIQGAEPTPVELTIANSIGNFNHIISMSSENFHIHFIGDVELANAVLAITGYGQTIYGLQSIDFDTLTLRNCGLLILGGTSVGQAITADNILGSGAYIHPPIIVNGDTLNLIDCTAAAWRWYGFSDAVTKGYTNNIRQLNAYGTTVPEYVLRTSVTEETNIERMEGYGDYIMYFGNYNYIDVERAELYPKSKYINIGEALIDLIWTFDDLDHNNPVINIDQAKIKVLHTADYGSPNLMLTGISTVGSLSVIDYSVFGNYTPGLAETGSVFNGIVYPVGRFNVVINNPNIESKSGVFLNFGSPSDTDYSSRILIKNGSVLCSRILSVTSYRGFFRDVVTFENVKLNSLTGGQSIHSNKNYLVFRVKPVLEHVIKSPQSGVLNFEFQNEITINGGGTIRVINPYGYDGAGVKIAGSRYFVGSITLYAVGGDIILQGYDTYSDSNIAISEIIPSGQSKVLICNTDAVRGVLTPGYSFVKATTGAVKYTIDLGYYSPVSPDNIETSLGTITLNGDESINELFVTGFWDKVNGTIRLDFTSAPTGNIVLNYSRWLSITAMGTWS